MRRNKCRVVTSTREPAHFPRAFYCLISVRNVFIKCRSRGTSFITPANGFNKMLKFPLTTPRESSAIPSLVLTNSHSGRSSPSPVATLRAFDAEGGGAVSITRWRSASGIGAAALMPAGAPSAVRPRPARGGRCLPQGSLLRPRYYRHTVLLC